MLHGLYPSYPSAFRSVVVCHMAGATPVPLDTIVAMMEICAGDIVLCEACTNFSLNVLRTSFSCGHIHHVCRECSFALESNTVTYLCPTCTEPGGSRRELLLCPDMDAPTDVWSKVEHEAGPVRRFVQSLRLIPDTDEQLNIYRPFTLSRDTTDFPQPLLEVQEWFLHGGGIFSDEVLYPWIRVLGPHVTTFAMVHTLALQDEHLLMVSRQCPNLTQFIVRGCRALGQRGIEAVVSRCHRTLELVDLGMNSLGGGDISNIFQVASQSPPSESRLKHLVLQLCFVDDARTIAKIATAFPNLTYLDISASCFDSTLRAEVFQEGKKYFQKLRVLIMASHHWASPTLDIPPILETRPELTTLDIRGPAGCDGVAGGRGACIAAWFEKFRKLKVVHYTRHVEGATVLSRGGQVPPESQ